MTREEFLKILEKNNYSYVIESDNSIVITVVNTGINLNELETMPENVVFENQGSVHLYSLGSLPEGTIFRNAENVYIKHFKNIHPTVRFYNKSDLWIMNPRSGWKALHYSEGFNIEDINSKELLNSMISKGIFI